MSNPKKRKAPKPSKVAGAFGQRELFNLPAFCPSLPKVGTRAMQALQDLATRPTLMQRDWLPEGKGWRLAAEVHRLTKELGWPVRSIRSPSTGRQAIYSLPRHAKQVAHRLLKGGAA